MLQTKLHQVVARVVEELLDAEVQELRGKRQRQVVVHEQKLLHQVFDVLLVQRFRNVEQKLRVLGLELLFVLSVVFLEQLVK